MSQYLIADGYDNVAGLLSLHQLEPPLFYDYNVGIKTYFKEYVSQIMTGDRKFIRVGLPSTVWELFKISLDEYAYLRENFGQEVTIRTLDKSTNTFRDYNAVMELPDISETQFDIGDWYQFRLKFWDLVEIP